MVRKLLYSFILSQFLISWDAKAQVNITCTNATAEQVLLGNYTPATYTATQVITDPVDISTGIHTRVSPDSLHAYLDVLRSFKNRNSGSDTVSNIKGIGAARRWVYQKFQQFSSQNENRLLPTYLQFDYNICNARQHRNIMAVLPGSDLSDKSVVIIEAHIDSRCADVCDTACLAEGMEDNGSGTALVMELARVMSKYTYKNTIVFAIVIGEEQGLYGGEALALYAQQKGLKLKAVLNNDITGGIICGKTSSPPSCPGLNDIDSTHVRLFSAGGFNSPHKGLNRYIKLEYKEMIQPTATVPMGIVIMTDEDRVNRGGDHIPFRQKGFTAIRMTSANEHGDANVTAVGYTDRQHTSSDILGTDTNADSKLDNFYVDFNYLSRNTVIDGNAMAMMAIGPFTPTFNFNPAPSLNDLTISITDPKQYLKYRVGLRTTTNDWDSVYTFSGTTQCTIYGLPQANYIASVAAVDDKGVESLFSGEQTVTLGIDRTKIPAKDIELLQNTPNPSDEATMISVMVNKQINYTTASVSITDITGKLVQEIPLTLKPGINEIVYEHGYNMSGTYIYSLMIDGKKIDSRKMIFSN